jgi:hypothetical protein
MCADQAYTTKAFASPTNARRQPRLVSLPAALALPMPLALDMRAVSETYATTSASLAKQPPMDRLLGHPINVIPVSVAIVLLSCLTNAYHSRSSRLLSTEFLCLVPRKPTWRSLFLGRFLYQCRGLERNSRELRRCSRDTGDLRWRLGILLRRFECCDRGIIDLCLQ